MDCKVFSYFLIFFFCSVFIFQTASENRLMLWFHSSQEMCMCVYTYERIIKKAVHFGNSSFLVLWKVDLSAKEWDWWKHTLVFRVCKHFYLYSHHITQFSGSDESSYITMQRNILYHYVLISSYAVQIFHKDIYSLRLLLPLHLQVS